MLALNRSDIEDIANGRHNSYVASQDKDELLRELAERLLKATPDTSDIDNKLDDISDILIKTEEVKDEIADIEEYLDEVRNVLQSITQ